jgi:RimJ/RimL family protein N-acetyltransferase
LSIYIRPPDDVYWHFRRLPLKQQVGAQYTSKEDGNLYRVRHDRVICRVVGGIEQETIDSIPFKLPAGAKVMTGVGWGFRMPISTFYQQIIGPSAIKPGMKKTSLDYLHLQMKLEGKGFNQECLLVRLGPDAEEIPLVLLAHTADRQTVIYFNEALPVELQIELSDRVSQFEFSNQEIFIEPIRAWGIRTKAGHYKTYIFPEQVARVDVKEVRRFSKSDPRVIAFGFDGLADVVYVIENNGMILSACVSSRQNHESAEAWVYTAPEHRRKGLAQMVVTAWAHSMLKAGIVPFYSHEIENTASANLAQSLQLIPVFEEISIEAEDNQG